MDRACFYLRIFPGTEAEYDRRHAEIWPELVDEIRESGLRNFSGFRRGTDVWYYTEGEPGRRRDRLRGPRPQARQPALEPLLPRRHRPDHRRQRRAALVRQGLRVRRASRSTARSSAALFGLVIDPERAADYEALHANPWPDLMAAIEASGFRNYQGFRRGAHVVYYGEFYPDMGTVFGQMGATEVNARWGAAFEGIITTITDADGNLLTADEIYHQD